MHPIDPFADRPIPRSTLGATLLRLRRHIDANRQREQAALELFQSWQSRWSDHKELITQRLECLDRELSDLTISAVPAPHLSLLALSASAQDDVEGAVEAGDDAASEDDEISAGIIRSSPNARWHEA